MRIKRIENTSDHDIIIEHADGMKQILQPGHNAINIGEVRNIEEIRRKATVVQDLSEINE